MPTFYAFSVNNEKLKGEGRGKPGFHLQRYRKNHTYDVNYHLLLQYRQCPTL